MHQQGGDCITGPHGKRAESKVKYLDYMAFWELFGQESGSKDKTEIKPGAKTTPISEVRGEDFFAEIFVLFGKYARIQELPHPSWSIKGGLMWPRVRLEKRAVRCQCTCLLGLSMMWLWTSQLVILSFPSFPYLFNGDDDGPPSGRTQQGNPHGDLA